MSILQKIFWPLFCVSFLCGCYEDKAELTLYPDGSGSLKQKLVFSERCLVATSENKGAQDTPAPDKNELIKQIGSAMKIKSIKQTDTPDGKRVIEFEATFSKAQQFFLSDYCQNRINLRIAPAGQNKAAIYCSEMAKIGDAGPNLTQLYGIAKGLYISRAVHLPAEIEKTNGDISKAANTVSWAMDLRNKEGLAKTKKFIKGPDNGKGFAVFSTSGLSFALPLKIETEPNKAGEEGAAHKEPAGLAAEVAWVSVQRVKKIDGTDIPKKSYTEIGVEISWNKGHRPVRHKEPVLLSLSDDLNNDLVTSDVPPIFGGEIPNYVKKKEFKLKEKAPSKGATKLKNLQGYVEVVTDVVKKSVVLQNVQELTGKDRTANPILDKLNFRIQSIQGRKLKVGFEGSVYNIVSVYMVKEDGSKLKKRGCGGRPGDWTFEFDEDISDLNKCELEVIVSETSVKVPFELEEMSIP